MQPSTILLNPAARGVGVSERRHPRAAPRRVKTCASAVQFSKYHGIGNDFILVDNRGEVEPCMEADRAVELCDRNFGIGADGVIFALRAGNKDAHDFDMRMFNSDGSEPEMCGNGIRCLARFISDLDGEGAKKYKVGTGAGLIQPELLENGQVRVDMGVPILEPENIPVNSTPNTPDGKLVAKEVSIGGSEWTFTPVSMGNPHAVVFRKNGGLLKLDDVQLAEIGPQFETDALFPAKVNTEFVELLGETSKVDRVRMCVWERGAGATLACGTGACAIVVAGVLEGLTNSECTVELPGGNLLIEWDQEGNNHVFMTGPAEFVFSGETSV
ncbi:hypothetical protein BSKO_03121 [Bryopsis sp. KO-2023]|nr:hypothetical protein BSKO_03121 [Bryopsis sp. KO-2023]